MLLARKYNITSNIGFYCLKNFNIFKAIYFEFISKTYNQIKIIYGKY